MTHRCLKWCRRGLWCLPCQANSRPKLTRSTPQGGKISEKMESLAESQKSGVSSNDCSLGG